VTLDRRREPVWSGGVDWVEHWRRAVDGRREAIDALRQPDPQPGYWDRRAGWFARLNREVDPDADPTVLTLARALRAGTLLDVGAGTGRYALPLAAHAARVTAVEPSAGMRAFLEREARERGLSNVRTVAAPWEDAAVEPHDVVLCAHVLNPIADVVPFIEKLRAYARRSCYIAMRVEQMAPEIDPLWPEVWGVARPPEPTALDLLNLLYAIGIHASMLLVPFTGPGPYDGMEDAVVRARQLLFLPPEPDERDVRIRRFLEDTLITRADGALDWPAPRQAGLVWWETMDSPVPGSG
jgi:SAM-dependent methyltransferase